MEEERFVTQTSPKSNLIYFFVIALVLGVLVFAAWIFMIPFRTYISLVGALLCVCVFGTGVILSSSPAVTLRFENDSIFIHDSNGKEYAVYAVSVSDFVFMQTPLEKKYNIGCLRIKNTRFWIFGLKNILETKEYINDHFPNW